MLEGQKTLNAAVHQSCEPIPNLCPTVVYDDGETAPLRSSPPTEETEHFGGLFQELCAPEAGGPSGGEQSQGQRRGPSAHIGEVPS